MDRADCERRRPGHADGRAGRRATDDRRRQAFRREEIRIKAPAKVEQEISKVPNSVTVITAQQIRESGARSIPELLRLVAGVNVRWNPMVQTIDIRGFGQNPFTSRVLLMIDGVPYNAWDKGFPQHPASISSSCRT